MELPTDRHMRRLLTHTVAHAAIDFSCFFVLFARFTPHVQPSQQIALGFLLYNLLAFGLQPLFGFVCDYFRGFPAAPAGCLVTLIGVCLPQEGAWVALVLCALGNAWFHVGAGADTLLSSYGHMWHSGLFVSSGALGVAAGTLAGRGGLSVAVPILLLAAVLLAEWWLPTQYGISLTRFWSFSGKVGLPAAFALLLCAVAIRGFAGAIVPMPWNTTAGHLLLAAGAAALGKLLGGILADVFGARHTAVLSLLLSAPLLCFFHDQPALCAIGLVLFNIPMPVTLCVVADLLPFNPGLAFGLTTLGLLVGTVPVFLIPLDALPAELLLLLLTLCAALCLFIATRNRRDAYHETV